MVKHHMVTGMHMTIESLRTQTLQDKNANIIVNRCRMTLFCSWYLIFLLFSLNLHVSVNVCLRHARIVHFFLYYYKALLCQ